MGPPRGRWLALALAALVLVCLSCSSSSADSGLAFPDPLAAQAEIRTLTGQLMLALNSKDLDAALGCASELVSISNRMRFRFQFSEYPSRGLDYFRHFLEQLFADYDPLTFDWTEEELIVDGQYARFEGTLLIQGTRAGGGEVEVEEQSLEFNFEDGQWRLVHIGGYGDGSHSEGIGGSI